MLEALKKLQQERSLTDSEMAFRLGCSRPYWNLIRHGRRAFTHDLAVKAAGAWPELTRHLLDMAEASVMSVAHNATEAA